MELGSINIVLNLAQFSQDGELSDHHFGVLIIYHEAFDVLDGDYLLCDSVLWPVNLSIRSRTDEFFYSVVIPYEIQVVHIYFLFYIN